MNRVAAKNDFQTSELLICKLLKVIVHAAYIRMDGCLYTIQLLLSTSPFSSLSEILAAYNTLMYPFFIWVKA